MDELTTLVIERAIVTREQAQNAILVVVGYLKGRLPSPIAGQIDILVSEGGFYDGTSTIGTSRGGLKGD